MKHAKPDASPQSLALARDPAAAATVSLGREGNVYVNPYTGAILGTGSARTTQFFQSMTSWHRYLGATGEYRAPGRSATGASNLAFLVLGVTGLYIWWPKQLTLQYLKPIVWFRRTSTGRARDFNWHNTIGFWCLIPIVIMTVSGAVISYPWASNLVYRLTGIARAAAQPGAGGSGAAAQVRTRRRSRRGAARRRGRADAAGRPAAEPRGPGDPDTLDRDLGSCRAAAADLEPVSLRLPNREGAPVAFTITDGAHWNAFARSHLTLNSARRRDRSVAALRGAAISGRRRAAGCASRTPASWAA